VENELVDIYIECSAKTGSNIDIAIEKAVNLVNSCSSNQKGKKQCAVM
jgi:hypothetical protein